LEKAKQHLENKGDSNKIYVSSQLGKSEITAASEIA